MIIDVEMSIQLNWTMVADGRHWPFILARQFGLFVGSFASRLLVVFVALDDDDDDVQPTDTTMIGKLD